VTKVSLRGLVRDEKGQALILALILLVIGGLIMAPLLAYMSTGIIAGGAYEKKADELYAADAGAEDAVWKIQDGTEVRPPSCITDPTSWNYSISDVNGKSVAVTITYVSNVTHTYHIVSTATGDGSGTKIDAYVTGDTVAGDFSGITNNVITSLGGIKYFGKVNVDPSEGEDHGPQDYYGGAWPTAEELEAWYLLDVQDATHYGSDTTIDLNGVNKSLGPLYVGGKLTIKNSSNTPATLTLTGAVYATGDTLIGTTDHPFTLGLNGTTVFVASDSSKYALEIGDRCSMDGSGCLIAVGGAYFAPQGDIGSEAGPVFTLSVQGSTVLQPSGSFYGSAAGNVTVDVKSGSGQSLDYPQAGFGVINFPGCTAGRFIYSIASWEVKPA
jgi:hypothetical protein